MNFELRVGVGRYRGRRIPAPRSEANKPRAFTPALVKEAAFQILLNQGAGPEAGYCFVDLCSGSGQIVLEALSRGYECLHACEPDPERFRQLTQTLRDYPETVHVHRRDIRRAAALLLAHPRTVAYADPPYSFWKGGRCEPIETLLGALRGKLGPESPFERILLLVQGPRHLEFEPSFDPHASHQMRNRSYRGTSLTEIDIRSKAGFSAAS